MKVSGRINLRCLYTNCKANGYTFCDKVGESCDFFIVNQDHRHEPDLVKFELLERRRLIKERATNSNDKARKILSLLEKPYDNTVRVQIPSYSADRQVIQRVQKANKPNYPKEPDSLASIDIPDFLKISISNELFLYFDSGPEDCERFFIFCTLKNLKLIENRDIFCDGTFKIAPKLFKQVYTFHVMIDGQSFPVIYVFLTRKTQDIYTRMLSKIEEGTSGCPKLIKSDFEQAFLNASATVFKDAEVYACFFHFPYILCEDVLSGFEEIKNHVNLEDKRFKDFYDYFGANYVVVYEDKRGRYNKIIQVAKEPRFPVKLWRVHGRIIENIPKTNNFC
ncbi:unnamed protein product [Brachionus calyciflorus]|uniref:MULE transposase domain-containing protein n=1 Tax=Brachionus calyciflorus TaxID=104777 RepID=A0A814PRW6_9BILA|nr:unnamed protein product [Brachionus calyciflorus]